MTTDPTPKPLWRWWLFSASLALWWRTRWDWARRLFGWCITAEWLAVAADDPILCGPGPTLKAKET